MIGRYRRELSVAVAYAALLLLSWRSPLLVSFAPIHCARSW